MMLTKFNNLSDLSRLPYFELREGRLVLADEKFGPSIDMHTHLAFSYGPTQKVDLTRETPDVELYLRADKAIDFDVYMNRNFTEHDLVAVERDMTRATFGAGGMRATHTLPNLLRDARALGIKHSTLLPIDFPFWSKNSESWLELTRGVSDIICFGSVHPFQRGVREQVEALAKMGARGLKFHPAVQMMPPDHRRSLELYRHAADFKLPILFHCGPVDIETRLGRRFCQVKRYERALAENPNCTFVLGHSGALQIDIAIELTNKYPNTYCEIASQSLPGVRKLVDELPPGRLMMGSDWPFYHQATALAKVLLATEGHPESTRRAVLYDNAASVFLTSREAA